MKDEDYLKHCGADEDTKKAFGNCLGTALGFVLGLIICVILNNCNG